MLKLHAASAALVLIDLQEGTAFCQRPAHCCTGGVTGSQAGRCLPCGSGTRGTGARCLGQ